MKKEICNQVLSKTEDNKVICLCCGIKDPLPLPPVSLEFYAACLKAFVKIHRAKGCNEKDLSKQTI